MSEEVKAVHREPHPFVGLQHMNQFVGRTVAFVGKVDRVEDNTLYMKTADGKLISNCELITDYNCANVTSDWLLQPKPPHCKV